MNGGRPCWSLMTYWPIDPLWGHFVALLRVIITLGFRQMFFFFSLWDIFWNEWRCRSSWRTVLFKTGQSRQGFNHLFQHHPFALPRTNCILDNSQQGTYSYQSGHSEAATKMRKHLKAEGTMNESKYKWKIQWETPAAKWTLEWLQKWNDLKTATSKSNQTEIKTHLWRKNGRKQHTCACRCGGAQKHSSFFHISPPFKGQLLH